MRYELLKGMLISDNGNFNLTQDEVMKFVEDLTSDQIDSIFVEGENVLVKSVYFKNSWREYWIGL